MIPVPPAGGLPTNLPLFAAGLAGADRFTTGGAFPYAVLTRNNVDIYWPGNNAASLYDGTVGAAATPTSACRAAHSNPHLGTGGDSDFREYPDCAASSFSG